MSKSMELYKIVATCANDSSTITLDWLPENFEGVRITQKFSWVNPIGFTPTFSVETMRVIEDDKTWIDAIWNTYGGQSVVLFAIYELNATATDYDLINTFKVDTDSINVTDHFTEFALISNSCIDNYNDTKNTARNFTGVAQLALPSTQKYINYVSLSRNGTILHSDNDPTIDILQNQSVIEFEENEDAKCYNSDFALLETTYDCYQFNRGAGGSSDVAIKASGSLSVTTTLTANTTLIKAKLYQTDLLTPILTLAEETLVFGGSITIDVQKEFTKIAGLAFADQDTFIIGIETDDPTFEITGVFNDLSVEIWVGTEIAANPFKRQIPYVTSQAIINDIFNNQATIESPMGNYCVTSSQAILKKNNYISLVPKDFLIDFCAANAAIVNFKNDGSVKIEKALTYFNNLLSAANAVEITDFKDVQFSPDLDLNFKSVSVGMQQREYEVYTYFNDWNKVLTFTQTGRVASENFDLSLTKFRVDFSGILDYIEKTAKTSTDTSSDYFIAPPAFGGRTTDEGEIYDAFTPRDMLESWRKVLEFCFYNYGLDTLELSSSSGDDFNLDIYGVEQFDDFVMDSVTPKILPVKVSMTCILSDIDFTEKILKITHNGVELFIFVTEAETTDKLSEQKIKGNLVSIPT